MVAKPRRANSLHDSIAARIVRAILRQALPFFARVEVCGKENVGEGGRVLVCNHLGWADPIWIAYAAYPKVVHQMAKQELFQSAWAARLLRTLAAFPVDRGRPSPETLKYAVSLVTRGEWLLIFPTGTRDQSQTQARRGAAVIASMAKAAVVPVRYEGPAKVRLFDLFRRPTIVVRFGPNIKVSPDSNSRQSTTQLTADLDRAIKALAATAPSD